MRGEQKGDDVIGCKTCRYSAIKSWHEVRTNLSFETLQCQNPDSPKWQEPVRNTDCCEQRED